jgi:outer membrane protein OmpA-like peptidoglycan-associated protein
MSAFPKILIILAIWFVYTFILFQGCTDTLCPACGIEEGVKGPAAAAAAESEMEKEPPEYPISFRWEEARPVTNEDFSAFRDSLLAGAGTENILEITGLYYEEEAPVEDYDNLGFARADQVLSLLDTDLPEERIRLRARLVDEQPGVREHPFEGVLFDWIKPEERIAETVEELPDRVNIRFPYNSVEKIYDPEVEAFFKQLADRVKETNDRVLLTGHADNSGTEEYNQELGMRRAMEIRQVLITYGIPADRIEVRSRGETQPIASNATEEGRHENRRVEIRVIENPSN